MSNTHDLDHTENTSNNEHFQDVLARGLADPGRRALLRRGVGLSAATMLPVMTACGSGAANELPKLAEPAAGARLNFTAVSKSLADSIVLPPGYTAKVIHATGDRIDDSVTAYSNAGTETDDWSKRIGDHHDGMELFYIDGNGKVTNTATNRAVLAVNHESSADAHFFHARGQTSGEGAAQKTGLKFNQFGAWDGGKRLASESIKEINHHGVSVVELDMAANGTINGYKTGAPLNRRITPNTVVNVTGPAAHMNDIKTLFQTKFDPTGSTARGTLNNCGSGRTPWGTFLTCEENWATYFNMPTGSTLPTGKLLAGRTRYGVAATAAPAGAAGRLLGQGWHTSDEVAAGQTVFARWNAAVGTAPTDDFRNEPHTFGYNLEIDPANAASVPAKRVAMGRFAHEAAVYGKLVAGKPIAFYMGCDSRNEYIYKFVTKENWNPNDAGGGIATGDKYLNEGKLYAAKFNEDGSGQWLELDISVPAIKNYTAFAFANQADVYVFTRHAADAVGATKMDRPEWGSVNPANGEVYFCLTNNSAANRAPGTTNAANPRAYADPDGNKGSGNPNGHIIRFREMNDASTATTFRWDIFVFGSEEDADRNTVNVSQLTANNSFSSPDGLWFSPATGILWIQTDDGAFTDEVNCMLLASVPGSVGDGSVWAIANSVGTTQSATQMTFVGGLLGESRLRRFLVGPKGCEITGLAETADGKSLLVNVQHPGEDTAAIGAAANFTFQSQWPGNGGGVPAYGPATGRPRSATIVITKTDGGVIGR